MTRRWSDRDHIRIFPNSIIRDRKKNPRFKIKHKEKSENYSEKGKLLTDELEETAKFSKRKEKVIEGESVFLELTTAKPISKEHAVLQKYFTFSLQTNEKSAIVSVDEPRLQNLKSEIRQYAEKEDYKTYISQIKSISRVRIKKISSELSSWITFNGPSSDVQIDLLPNLGREYYGQMLNRIEAFLKSNDSPVIDQFYDEQIASIRATLKPETLQAVVQGIDSVWQARKTPVLISEEPQSLELKQLPKVNYISEGVEPVCILDTGVDSSHPLLNGVLIESHDFTPDGDPSDFNGHGTFIAGLAAYGNLDNLENKKSIEPTAKIVSAKVQSKTKQLNRGFLEKRITAAIENLGSKAKIFSLSLMYENYCNSVDPPSNLAYMIDKLSLDNGVLFVVSSGNLKKELQPLNRRRVYPSYFDEECCIIYHGAESCCSVTVGGVAHKHNSQSVARSGQPSPFTRRGDLGQRAKPDVVHDAGNVEIDNATRELGANNGELGVVSLGTGNNLIAYDLGTSYSTPSVANILARLQGQFPTASLNLLKALLIHSASWPDTHCSLNIGNDLKKAIYGKGKPDFDRAAFSQNYSPTYIVEDSLKCDETASIPFLVPSIMSNIWDRRIRITLVYDPPVNVGVNGYTLVDLDFKLLKQLKGNKFVEQRIRWSNDFRRPWDNVKTDVFTWQQSGWGKEWLLKIVPNIRFRNEFEGLNHVQNYAVVITIEDPSKNFNIYDTLTKERRMIRQPIKPLKPYKQEVLVTSS